MEVNLKHIQDYASTEQGLTYHECKFKQNLRPTGANPKGGGCAALWSIGKATSTDLWTPNIALIIR
jgi:hypothetical protein